MYRPSIQLGCHQANANRAHYRPGCPDVSQITVTHHRALTDTPDYPEESCNE